jgi:predicted NAD/FAD-binding protein
MNSPIDGRQRIAVVGSGISGLSAAYFLSRKHEVHLFEKDRRLGGHTHTHLIEDPANGRIIPIDTGFIVHNDRTYPNLVRLFAELGIETQPSDMSFGVSCRQTGFEYSSRGLSGFFAQRSNLLRPSHYGFFRELLRFNREAPRLLESAENCSITLGEYLERESFSCEFTDRYLYPMAAAVWSTSPGHMRDFPAYTLIRFFENHGFLGINTHPKWKTLKHGSHTYIPKLTAPYAKCVYAGADIQSVQRDSDRVTLRFADGSARDFDQVVFATHGDQVLRLLDRPTSLEQQIVGAFRSSVSHTWLHTDASVLPKRLPAQASWNYHVHTESTRDLAAAGVTVTYDMNRLQSIHSSTRFCVTLNAIKGIDERKVLRRMEYAHPLYTLDSVRAQARWSEINGQNRTHFCGAYWFYGFHEDGLNSALRVAKALGVEW